MKIPQKYPQFEGRIALLIVTGLWEAKFYLAKDGLLDKIEEFSVPVPRYTDREGMFLRSGKGVQYGFGAVREQDQKEIRDRFLSKLDETLVRIQKTQDIDLNFLFAPKYVLPEAKRLAKKRLGFQNGAFGGNYFKHSKLELLEKILKANILLKSVREQSKLSDEARDILKKPKN